MNNCTLNVNLKNYENLKDFVLDGFSFEDENVLESSFSTLDLFDKQDQKELIAQLEQDPDLEIYKEQLAKEKELIYNIWEKEYPQKPFIQGIDKEYLDLRLDTPSHLTHMLTTSESQRFLKEVQKEIISKTFFDLTSGVIIDEDTINQAIVNYQRDQLKILNPTGYTDFTWAITNEHYNQNYRTVIQNTIGKINNGSASYEIKKALLILTNLDNLIEYFHPFVKVLDASKKDKVRSAKGKYNFIQPTLKKGDYNNEEKNTNADRITSSKLKAIIETIPRGEGQYVSIDFFYEFVRYMSNFNSSNFLEDAENFYLGKNKQSLNAFIEYLNAYKKAYDEKINSSAIVNKGKIHQNFNLIDLIQNYIESSDNKYYLEVSQTGVEVKTKLDYKDSKQVWKNAIINTIKSNFKNNTILVKAYQNLNIDGVDLSKLDNNDLELLQYLELLTGISLQPSMIAEHFKNEDRYIIGKFLKKIQELVQEYVLIDDYTSFEYNLVRAAEYVKFTGILTQLEAHNKSTLMSQDGKELAGMSIHTTMGNFKKDKKNFEAKLKSKNILYRNDQSDYNNIAVISSIQSNDPSVFYKPTELTEIECSTNEIGKLYYNPKIIRKNNQLEPILAHFQIDAYSDKTSIFAGGVNIAPFLEMDKKTLLNTLWEQSKNYYEQITEDILKEFEKLGITIEGKSLTERYLNLFKQLENKTLEDYSDTILENKIELVKDFHFCENKKGQFRPNPRLFYWLKMVDGTNELKSKKLFLDYLNEGLSNFLTKIKGKNLGIDYDKIDSIWKIDNEQDSEKAFLEKYFLIRQLVRNAYLQITIQPSFFHDNKGDLLTVDELKEFNDNSLLKIKENISKTATAGKKRGNFAGASYSTLLTGKQYTIPKTLKMALINEPKEDIYTYFATVAEGQSLHDGAISTPGIVSVWETRSQLNTTPKGTTRKYIFLENNLGYGVQIKCADNVISNQLVRNGNPHLKLLLKKAYRVASLNEFNEKLKNFYTGENQVQDIVFDNIYRNINGHLCKLTKLEADEFGIKLNWIDSVTGNPITIAEANSLFDSDKVDLNGYWQLDNLYDLWQAFGGEHCQSYKDGEIIYSESNNEVIADLISFLNAQDVKENVISKLVNPSAVKSGKTNQNSKERVEDESKNLLTFTFDASKYGLQQDYAHESNESESPFPTQVLSALAFNGENIEACDRIYEAVGWLIRNNLSKLPGFENIKETNKWLGKKLLSAFKSVENIPTNGENVVNKFLQDLNSTLPTSDPNIYYKVTQQILSDLNNSTLRQKLPGAGLIQCPSKNIVQIYEDNTGKKYTRTQLFKKYNTTNLQQLNNFIKDDAQFEPKEVHVADLNIQDTILFNGVLTKITNPAELYRIYDEIGSDGLITKVYTEPRDLATSKITWEVEGKKYNYWLLPTTQAMFDAVKKHGLNSVEYKEAVQEDQKIRQLIKNKKIIINGKVVDIKNYKYQAGEQIAPKIYKNRMGLGNSALSDINEDYFIDKINHNYFYSTDILLNQNKEIYCVCQAPNDFDFTQYAKEFYFGDFSDEKLEHNVYIDKNNNVYSANNEFLFTLPFLNSDNVIINANYDTLSGKMIVKIQETIEDRIEDYLNSFDPNEAMFYSSKPSSLLFGRNKLFNPNDENTKLNFAKNLYNSFILANTTLSLRIPTQAFQSFMVSETVAFLETDENLVYNNIWEMIFQGSDFDIDKAYTIMYAVDNNGLIKGNAFTKYNNTKNIVKSLQLPLPNYSEIDYSEENNFEQILEPILKEFKINNYEELKNHSDYYTIITKLINTLNNSKERLTYNPQGGYFKLIKDLNEYNGFRTITIKGQKQLKPTKFSNHYIKNIIVQGMMDISSDIANLKSSSELMITSPMTKYLSEQINIINEYDPFFVWLTQVQNAIGKTDVGIAANGIKVASTLQQFYNKEFLTTENIEQYDLNIPINLSYDGKEINKTIHHIANLNLSNTAIKKLYGTEDVELIRQQLNNTENVAFNLSILLSLAVDNAKELALAKMYGTPDLLKFHVTLAILGFNAEEIVKLSTKYLGLITEQLQQNNRLLNKFNKINIIDVIENLKISPEEKSSLVSIFEFADEITNLAQLLKINQGISPDYYTFSDFTKKFIKELNLDSSYLINFMQSFKEQQLYELNRLKEENVENISAIRQLEVIVKHPLFNNLARAIFKNKDFLNHISAKTIILDKIKDTKNKINDRNVIKIIDDYIIGQTLLNLNISLSPKQLKDVYNVNVSNILEKGSLKLTNNVGLEQFIDIMNTSIIPSLKKHFNDNYFFKSLQLKSNKQYTLPFNSFSAEQSPLMRQNLNLAKMSFEEVAGFNSYLDFNGIELTIGDLFQLYQLITNKNSFGNGLKYCVENTSGNLKIYETISNFYSKLDQQALNGNISEEFISHLSEYISATQYNDYIEYDDGLTLSTNNGPIKTFNQPIKLTSEEIINKIKTYFNNSLDVELIQQGDLIEIKVKQNNNSFSVVCNGLISQLNSLDVIDIIAAIENNVDFSKDRILQQYESPEELNKERLNSELNDLIKDLKLDDIKFYQVSTIKDNASTLPRYFKTSEGEYCIVNYTIKESDLYKLYFKRKTQSNNHTMWLMQIIRDKFGYNVNYTNYKDLYNQVQDLLKDDAMFKELANIILEEPEFFKSTALKILENNKIQLTNPNVFYVDSNLENLYEGCILNETGIDYIYLGKNQDDDLIGAQITDVTNITVLKKENVKIKEPLKIIKTNVNNFEGEYFNIENSNYTIQIGDKIDGKKVIHIATDSNSNTYYIVQNQNVLEQISLSKAKTKSIQRFKSNVISNANRFITEKTSGLPGMLVKLSGQSQPLGYIKQKLIKDNKITYILNNGEKIKSDEVSYFYYSNSMLNNFDLNFFNMELDFDNLRNYSKLSNPLSEYQIDDIIETTAGLYKKIDNYTYLKRDGSKNSVTSTIEGKVKKHFTKTTNNVLIKKNSKINISETVNSFLQQFVTMTGIPISIDINNNVSNGTKAVVNENGITIYVPEDVTNEEDIMKTIVNESTHEYLHVLLAFLRKTNATAYYNLIEGQKIDINLNEEYYSGDFQKKEEIYIRNLTQQITEAIYENSTIKFNDLIVHFNNVLSSLFGCNFDVTTKLFDNLSDSRFVVKDIINFETVVNENISLDEFNKIIKDC